METYTVTGFENDGTLVLNEMFEASDDQSAKQQGLGMLRAAGHEHKGARIVRRGQLIYFERCKLPGKLKGTAS
ncbi:YhzD family protein [Exiguobacterium sp. KJ 601]|uniref:YhzD family protein n=1 Tax=Exiguobacterium sp. KJ 601 TaxID=2782569 RepID=UPI0022AF55B6|nr:YhzD family protein [Exiguobacterium sp. KJ 601]